jgi:hypothetical protein
MIGTAREIGPQTGPMEHTLVILDALRMTLVPNVGDEEVVLSKRKLLSVLVVLSHETRR